MLSGKQKSLPPNIQKVILDAQKASGGFYFTDHEGIEQFCNHDDEYYSVFIYLAERFVDGQGNVVLNWGK